MRRKSKVTFAQKLSAVKNYLEGRKSQGQLAKEHNVAKISVQRWISFYQSKHELGLITSSQNTCYSKELIYAAIEEYLLGTASQLDVCKNIVFVQQLNCQTGF